MSFMLFVEDADNFEPRDVKPAPKDQWDGEDEEDEGETADVSIMFGHIG